MARNPRVPLVGAPHRATMTQLLMISSHPCDVPLELDAKSDFSLFFVSTVIALLDAANGIMPL